MAFGWGLLDESDQFAGNEAFHEDSQGVAHRIGYDLQDQLSIMSSKEEEKTDAAFHNVVLITTPATLNGGISRGMTNTELKYTGSRSRLPKQLRPPTMEFWDEFDRVISFLRSNGLFRSPKA